MRSIAKKRGSKVQRSSSRPRAFLKMKSISKTSASRRRKTQKSRNISVKKPNDGIVQWFPDALYSHQLNLIRLNQLRLMRLESCLQKMIEAGLSQQWEAVWPSMRELLASPIV